MPNDDVPFFVAFVGMVELTTTSPNDEDEDEEFPWDGAGVGVLLNADVTSRMDPQNRINDQETIHRMIICVLFLCWTFSFKKTQQE